MVWSFALPVIYLIFCALVGLCGSHRRLGFTGTFVLSILLTPIVVLIVLLVAGPAREPELKSQPQGKRLS